MQREARSRSNKKAVFFFIVDVIFAAMILIITIVLILGMRVSIPDLGVSYSALKDYTNYVTQVEVRDITNDYLVQLSLAGEIPEQTYTVSELAGYYIKIGQVTKAEQLIEEITLLVLPDNFGIEYVYNDTTGVSVDVYSRGSGKEFSNTVVSSKTLTYNKIDATSTIGPAITEVTIWQ